MKRRAVRAIDCDLGVGLPLRRIRARAARRAVGYAGHAVAGVTAFGWTPWHWSYRAKPVPTHEELAQLEGVDREALEDLAAWLRVPKDPDSAHDSAS